MAHESKAFAVALGFGLVLVSSMASAVPITGSISFSDGFGAAVPPPTGLPTPPTGSIVSGLNPAAGTIDVQPAAQVFGASGAFAGTPTPANASGFGAPFPDLMFTTTDGFSFTLSGVAAITPTALTCNADGLCNDAIQFALAGTVDDGPGGLDPTLFLGIWTAQGSCLGSGATCESDVTGSWSASLTATGQVITVAEPSALALMGIALVGLAVFRRRAA